MNYTATFAALGCFFLWVFIATFFWSRRMKRLYDRADKENIKIKNR